MIRHVVLFKFKTETSDGDRRDFLAALRDLPREIHEVQEFEVGEDFLASPRSYHVALIAAFRDRHGLKAYAEHPKHAPVLARSRQICEDVVVADYEF